MIIRSKSVKSRLGQPKVEKLLKSESQSTSSGFAQPSTSSRLTQPLKSRENTSRRPSWENTARRPSYEIKQEESEKEEETKDTEDWALKVDDDEKRRVVVREDLRK